MKQRYSINVEYDLRLANNDKFINSCYDYIFNNIDNMNNGFDYNEKDQNEKLNDALYYLHLSAKHVSLFDDINFLLRFKSNLDWVILSSDSKIFWDFEKFTKLDGFYKFNLISKNPNLTPEIINHFFNEWDWKVLSTNPQIIKCNIFEHKYFIKLIGNTGFDTNSALNLDILIKLKDIYDSIDFEEYKGLKTHYFNYNGERVYWGFSWERAFKHANINWNQSNISVFLDILNNLGLKYSNNINYSRNCWSSISQNISDKQLILNYKNEINFFAILEYQNHIIWDKELFNVLINNFNAKSYHTAGVIAGNLKKGLPYYIEKIKITDDAIIENIDFWSNSYYWESYKHTRDEDELQSSEHKFWDCLGANINIKWTIELLKALNKKNYKVGDDVFIIDMDSIIKKGVLKSFIKGTIIASQQQPLSINQYEFKLLYPTKEYIVAVNRPEKGKYFTYKGIVDVCYYEIDANLINTITL